jgi:hypothetical protein
MVRIRKVDLLPGRPYLGVDNFLSVPYTHTPFLSPVEAIRSVLDSSRESTAINRRVVVGRSLCTYKVGVFLDGEFCGTYADGVVHITRPGALDVMNKTFGEQYVVRESIA